MEQAFAVLRSTDRVESSLVGYAGIPGCNWEAFKVLSRAQDQSMWFGRLVDEATLAGQLYGLGGLYLADRALFGERLAKFEAIDALVQVDTLDVTENLPVHTVAEAISRGRWINDWAAGTRWEK